MRTSTFTQKLFRQRSFFNFLIPLFAVFIGLGSATMAYGQSTINFRRAFVASGQTVATSVNRTYDASAPTTPGAGVFDGTNFGSFNLASGQILLQGGEIEIVEAPGENFLTAEVTYGIKQNATLTTTGASNIPALTSTIALTQTGYDADTRTRTFRLNNAAINILALAPVGGAGTSYRFDISISTGAGSNDDGDQLPPILGARRKSVFTATGNPVVPSTITANTITLDPNGVPSTPPVTDPPTPPTPNNVTIFNINPAGARNFPGANLSSAANNGTTYDVNSGQLLLTGTTVTTTQDGPNNITSVILYYRTRLTNDAGGAFQPITLTLQNTAPDGTKTFVLNPLQGGNTISQPNLIATPAVTQAGTYAVDVYYQANGTNSGTGFPFTITDPPAANSFYTATFDVTGSRTQTTIWTGGVNDNWFNPGNWSDGVPTRTINALVRDLGAGNNVPYPNIYANAAKVVDGVILYDNTGLGNAECLDLTMGGSSQAARSITRLIAGQLDVYGNFNNNFDSFIQREKTLVRFSGESQNITGGSFVAVEIDGAGGVKNLEGVMSISEYLKFTRGVLNTDITRPNVSVVVLADRAEINGENGAQLIGENDITYLRGFVRTSRRGVSVGETRTYGNMGLTLTFTGTSNPGNTDVTRNTVEAYSPVSSRYGIRRIFGVRPTDPGTNAAALEATMLFRYRDSETMNLAGPDTRTPGDKSIPEPQLTLFVSSNSGNTFAPLGRDGAVNTTDNILTKTGVRTFATFTLGDELNPLPVRLTAFDAKRIGNDALVTWQTATEENSKGYEVQVSTNGKDFRTLASVPSANPNSMKLTSYSYLDTEKNKTGLRYYRLRQIDIDGKDAFFAPRTVSFDGKLASASNLVAYPNPFNSNDELHLAVQSTAGKGQLSVTDLTGRTIRQQSVEMVSGLTDLTVAGMKELKTGIYMVRLTLPTGEVKNLKVVKQ